MTGRARLLLRIGAGAAALLAVAFVVPRYGAVYVGGSSMRPALVAGDLAIYRRGRTSVQERDIVLFARHDGSRVLHRVTRRFEGGVLRTRGDANTTPDPERVDRRDIEGVVVAFIPTGRVVAAVVSGVRWCYNHVPIANRRR